jgi:hypothetical protein
VEAAERYAPLGRLSLIPSALLTDCREESQVDASAGISRGPVAGDIFDAEPPMAAGLAAGHLNRIGLPHSLSYILDVAKQMLARTQSGVSCSAMLFEFT